MAHRACRGCTVGGHDHVAFVGQDLREQFPDADLVIDDQNIGHGDRVELSCAG